MTDSPAVKSQSVAVIRRRRAQPLFGRHPWVFAGAVDRIDSSATPAAGDCIEVRSQEGEFIAWGLVNPTGNIRVRLYSWDPELRFGRTLLAERLTAAVRSRQATFDLKQEGTACRLVFSESDQLSGLTVDYYDRFLVVKFTSLALYQYRDAILDLLDGLVHPRGVWLRTERGMREAEGLEVNDGLVRGEAPPRPLFIHERELQFGVDVCEGQKTGFYLDQRNNRRAVTRYTVGHQVLDAFCFSGGFGITAVRCGGATGSLGIDSSASALRMAAANADLNSVGDRCRFQQGDVKSVLTELAEQGRMFDTVVLDPPRMARTRGGLSRALRGYVRLNEQGLQVLRPGGILVSCSCSGLVSRIEFQEVLATVSRQTGRHIRILETLGQPDDHPVSATCAETEYLKVFICRVS